MEGRSYWVQFKYEKLLLFCYRCGCIMHGLKGCSMSNPTRCSNLEESKPWGLWLRANEPKRIGSGGSNFSKAGERQNSSRVEEDEERGGSWAKEDNSKIERHRIKGNPRHLGHQTMVTNSEDSMAHPLTDHEERNTCRARAEMVVQGQYVAAMQGEVSGNMQ
jgi:hypothetical protein